MNSRGCFPSNILYIDPLRSCNCENIFKSFQCAYRYMEKNIPISEPTVFVFYPGSYTENIVITRPKIYLEGFIPDSVVFSGGIQYTDTSLEEDALLSIRNLKILASFTKISFVLEKAIYNQEFVLNNLTFIYEGNVSYTSETMLSVDVRGTQGGQIIRFNMSDITFSLEGRGDQISLTRPPICSFVSTSVVQTRINMTNIFAQTNDNQCLIFISGFSIVFMRACELFHNYRFENNVPIIAIQETIDDITLLNCNLQKLVGTSLFCSAPQDTIQAKLNFFMSQSSTNGAVELENYFREVNMKDTLLSSSLVFGAQKRSIGTVLKFETVQMKERLDLYGCEAILSDCVLKSERACVNVEKTDLFLSNCQLSSSEDAILIDNGSNMRCTGSSIIASGKGIVAGGVGQFLIIERSNIQAAVGNFFTETASFSDITLAQSNLSITETVVQSVSQKVLKPYFKACNFSGYGVMAESTEADTIITASSSNPFQGVKTLAKASYKAA